MNHKSRGLAKATHFLILPTWFGPCSEWEQTVSLEACPDEMSEKLIPKKEINYQKGTCHSAHPTMQALMCLGA